MRFIEFTGMFANAECEELEKLGITNSEPMERDKMSIDLDRVECYYPATENGQPCGTKLYLTSGVPYCVTMPYEEFKKLIQ